MGSVTNATVGLARSVSYEAAPGYKAPVRSTHVTSVVFNFSRRYHGTTWVGCEEIVKLVRILPMYAGGRWEEYGAKPLVYTSIDKSCAGRYPFASLTAVTTYVAEL